MNSITPPARRAFYLGVSLLIVAVVVTGFSRTIAHNLLHAPYVVPAVLYVHGITFSGWVLLFATQAALIRYRNVALHRALGIFGGFYGVMLVLVGVGATVAMTIIHAHQGPPSPVPSLVPLTDMVAFAVPFGLALHWRRRPEFHRRLMFVATCMLMAAPFFRLAPPAAPLALKLYMGVDGLIVLGALRDLIVDRRIHVVYWVALPAAIAAQTFTIALSDAPAWLELVHRVTG